MQNTLATRDLLAEACATPRVQPYRYIHKALRLLFAQAVKRAGALDVTDPTERAALVEEVESVLAICADHLAHENRFLHEPLRQRAPRAVMPFDDDHAEHLQAIAALRLLLQRVRDGGAEAPALAYELYLRLSQFVGESLIHMAEEESRLTQALWAHCTDAEIVAQIDALHATLSPAEHAFYLRWMARALNAAELAELLGEMQASLPADAFAAAIGVVHEELGAVRFKRVARILGLGAHGGAR